MDGSSTCPGEKGLSITLGDCFDSSYLRGKKVHLFTPKSRFQAVFIMKTDHLALKNIPCFKKAVQSTQTTGQHFSKGSLIVLSVISTYHQCSAHTGELVVRLWNFPLQNKISFEIW